MAQQDRDTLTLAKILEPAYADNPYLVYHQLRSADPVYWDGVIGGWVLTRHADIQATLRDPRLSAERLQIGTEWLPEELQARLAPPILALTRQMLFLDPPDHTRLRGLVSKAFTPRVVDTLRPRIQAVANELLDQALTKPEIDLIETFSYPFPAIVIAELLGVPPEDRLEFTSWSMGFANLINGSQLTFEGFLQSLNDVADFMDYFRTTIRKHHESPQNDLLQAMIEAEESGTVLSEEELLGNCVLLLAAGHGTTTHLIGNGMLALLRHSDQLALLQERPTLINQAVEELLRYDSPVQLTSRTAKSDLVVGGKQIQAGQTIYTCLGAANYDPEQFPEPDTLDIRRAENRQMAFGHGVHFCLGAPLARIEASIAFTTLLSRLKSPRLLTPFPPRDVSLVFRGLNSLPIAHNTTTTPH